MDALPRVIEGIRAARKAGLDPLKINSVAIKGYNDDEIVDLVEFAREFNSSIRFIEFMPLDGLGEWSADRMVLSGDEILRKVSQKHALVPRGREQGETTVAGFSRTEKVNSV